MISNISAMFQIHFCRHPGVKKRQALLGPHVFLHVTRRVFVGNGGSWGPKDFQLPSLCGPLWPIRLPELGFLSDPFAVKIFRRSKKQLGLYSFFFWRHFFHHIFFEFDFLCLVSKNDGSHVWFEHFGLLLNALITRWHDVQLRGWIEASRQFCDGSFGPWVFWGPRCKPSVQQVWEIWVTWWEMLDKIVAGSFFFVLGIRGGCSIFFLLKGFLLAHSKWMFEC